nr:hypothetical protein [Phenylobacterium aquaticum]
MGDHKAALADFRKAAELDPQSSGAWYEMGQERAHWAIRRPPPRPRIRRFACPPTIPPPGGCARRSMPTPATGPRPPRPMSGPATFSTPPSPGARRATRPAR